MAYVAVLGAGSWGTALSIMLADNGHSVRLWTHRKSQADEINSTRINNNYLDVTIPENIVAYNDLKSAIDGVSAIVLVVPTKAIREICQELNDKLTNFPTIIHATKGLEPGSLKRVSQVIGEELNDYAIEDIVVLSGPSHAEEVGDRQPTTVTVSSLNNDNAEFAQDLFMNESFRVYTSDDMIGLELGGALKNIIALGAGISDGLGFGDNAKSALITRGLAEITRLGVSLGADPVTFLGLSGVGDLIATCTSKHSRNWRAGNKIGEGQTLEEILQETGMVIEGARTTKAAYQFAEQQQVEMPITEGLYRVLFADENPRVVVEELMNRNKREELSGIPDFLNNGDTK